MEVRRITVDELIEARNISAVAFNWNFDKDMEGVSGEEFAKEMKENPPSKADYYYEDTWAAFTDEGEMMAAICVIPYKVYFDGQVTDMAGVGGVCTYPHFRKGGSIRGMFEKFLPELYEKGVLFSYLYPFSETFYRKFGYERSGQKRIWKMELKNIPDFDYRELGEMKLCRSEKEFGPLKEAYEAFAANHNMCVSRDRFDWDHFKKINPFLHNHFLHYYMRTTKDGGSECGGYMLFDIVTEKDDEMAVDCKEFVYRDLEALRALLAFAKGFSGSYRFLRLNLPASCNLDYFVPDYAQSASNSAQTETFGMVRAVNVEKILQTACYQGSGEFSVQITDPTIEENNRIFTVRFLDGKAEDVLVQRPEETLADQVDMVLPVNLFASGIVGSLTAEEMEYRPEVQRNCDREKAAKVFYRKSNWINNYF